MPINRKDIFYKFIFIALPFIIIITGILIVVSEDYTQNLIPCLFKSLTGYDCPGCGNTRSVLSLLHGDFPRAVKYNPFPPFAIITGALFYTEWGIRLFGKKKDFRFITRSALFWGPVLALFIIYYAIRNFFFIL